MRRQTQNGKKEALLETGSHIFTLSVLFLEELCWLTERNITLYCDFAVRHLGPGEPVLEKVASCFGSLCNDI